MFRALEASGSLSRLGRNLAVGAAVLAVACALGEGLLYGIAPSMENYGNLAMVRTWLYNLNFLFQQFIFVGAIVFVGAKFIETRTVLTVGFAKLDADKMRVQGPDEDNFVWVGQRYGSKFEAESMAVALQSRLEASSRKA